MMGEDMSIKKRYKIKSKVYLWPGSIAAWHFLGVPKLDSIKIKETFGKNHRGFGSIPVTVTLGKTIWNTSIFPDSKSNMYVLPLKARVRKIESVYDGDVVTVVLEIR